MIRTSPELFWKSPCGLRDELRLLLFRKGNALAVLQSAISGVVAVELGKRFKLLLSEVPKYYLITFGSYVLDRDHDLGFKKAQEAPSADDQVLLFVGTSLHHPLDVADLIIIRAGQVFVGQFRDADLACRRCWR